MIATTSTDFTSDDVVNLLLVVLAVAALLVKIGLRMEKESASGSLTEAFSSNKFSRKIAQRLFSDGETEVAVVFGTTITTTTER